jgi:hypothetical protein
MAEKHRDNSAGARIWLTRTGPALIVLLLLALLYNGYYLFGGFHGDDAIFLSLAKRDPLPYSRWLGMWAADMGAMVEGLWYFEGEGLKAFFRPLPSIIFEGSVRLLGERAFPLHLFSIVVHGLVAGAVFALVRRLTSRPGLALLAGVFFLSFEDHSMGLGIITMATDAVCVLFVVVALIAHAAWLTARRPWQLVVALLALWPAFLSKESAVLAPMGMALMTLLIPRGVEATLGAPADGEEKPEGWSLRACLKDWLSWAPALLMMVAYLGLYWALGFGGLSSGMYIDPFAAPGRYLLHLTGHLPVMWLATLSPVPPSLPWFLPALLVPFALVGVVAFVVWGRALWPLRKSGLVVWAMALYILALLPQMASDASERALYFPAVAASILLAVLAAEVGFLARRIWPDRPPAPRFTRIVGWGVLLVVLVPGALLSMVYPFVWQSSFSRLDRDALTAVPHIERQDPAHVVLLNGPSWLHGLYLPAILEHQVGRRVDVQVLSSMNGVVSLVRLTDTDFMVRADRAGWLTNPMASMLRPPGRPRQGRVFERDLLTATLSEMTRRQTDVAAVRFHIRVPLEDPSLLFLTWDGESFRPLDVAALPADEEIVLADTSDIWATMW